MIFILKWVNFLGHSFNLKCDKEFVLIMFNGMRCAIVILMCMFSVYQCISGTKAIISIEITFSLLIDFLIVWKSDA